MKGQNRSQKRTKNFTVDFTGDIFVFWGMAEAQNIRQIESEQVALVQNIFAERARNPKHSGAAIFTFDIKGGAAEKPGLWRRLSS